MTNLPEKQNTPIGYIEEDDYHYVKERLYYIGLIKRLGIVAILAAIALTTLSSIQLFSYVSFFLITLLSTNILFLTGAILSVFWANRAGRTFRAHAELFRPRINDHLTRIIFVLGLILAGASAVMLVNLFLQRDYPTDFLVAQSTNASSWNSAYEGKTLDGLINYSKIHFIVQSCFTGFFFFFFLLASRATFRCLKWSNQAMSYLVFLGNILLLAFGLGIIYFAEYAFGYGEYPQLRAHFPVWNIRGLYFTGIAVIALSFVGFLVDYKRWRIGFFALAFLLLLVLILLVNFTGYAYRHTRQTYECYKGVGNEANCIDRMRLVHSFDLEAYGCPQKYISLGRCESDQTVQKWEGTKQDNSRAQETAGTSGRSQARTTITTESDAETITTQPDGTQTIEYSDGSTVIHQSDQTIITKKPNGETITTQPDGTRTIVYSDGSTVTRQPDKTTIATGPDGETITTQPDGTQNIVYSDGSTVTRQSDKTIITTYTDGTTTIKKVDGTTVTKSSNGTVAIISPNGAIQIIDTEQSITTLEKDGTVTTRYKSGEFVIIYIDGVITFTKIDGTTVTTQPNGTIIVKHFNGTIIEERNDNKTSTAATIPKTPSFNTSLSLLVDFLPQQSLFVDESSTASDSAQSITNRYCLNTKCCGLLGGLYTESLMSLANFGLLVILTGCLVSIGCYYFWYIAGVESTRDKNKDLLYVCVTLVLVVVFFGLQFGLDKTYVHERLGSDSRHV